MVHSRNSLLIALIATTVVVTGALSWSGWLLLDQQRALDQQNAQRTQDAAAGSMAASIREKLAEAGDHLSTTVANPAAPPTAIEAAVLLKVRADASVTVAGERGLPFVPVVPTDSGSGEMFAEGHALEFVRNDLTAAASLYRGLSERRDVAVRAGALLRLGRVEVNAERPRPALAAYERLATMGTVRVEGLPAEFVGLIGQRIAANLIPDPTLYQSLTDRLIRGLDTGEWALTRRQAAFYRDELNATEAPPAWPLAEAVDAVWTEFGGTLSPRGLRVFGDDSRRVLVMWRTGSSTTAMLAAFLDEFLPAPSAGAQWRLEDPEGRWIAGQRTEPGGPVSTRLVGDSDFPWTLSVGGTAARESVDSQRALLAMMAAMLVFLWAALYFMARAIRREAVVARLQSDFVAAVSHEFRSPLTTIRQMTEMLEMGRVVGDDRRQSYYQVLTGETARLQRLVETLLNFGRMEAGAARYTMGDVDLAALIRRVVREVEPIAVESGKRIELDGPSESVLVRADENALALAVRNLLDNAIKYSPDGPMIRVEWGREDGHGAIRVIDRGIGIPPGEQRSIFEKFVRGHSAIEANVAGTGLGLSMVRQILDAHAGAVRVESEVGRGSTFTLVLPMIVAQRADPKVGPYDETGYEESGRGRPSGRPAADAVAQS